MSSSLKLFYLISLFFGDKTSQTEDIQVSSGQIQWANARKSARSNSQEKNGVTLMSKCTEKIIRNGK
jgi:hypothetical protein